LSVLFVGIASTSQQIETYTNKEKQSSAMPAHGRSSRAGFSSSNLKIEKG
jgi:hypothetical protein